MEPGARWHITAPLCAAISRMRHRGVGKFASDHQEGGLLVIWPNAGVNVATAPPPPPSPPLGFIETFSLFSTAKQNFTGLQKAP